MFKHPQHGVPCVAEVIDIAAEPARVHMRLLMAVDSPSKCEAVFRALKVEAMSNALAKDTVTLSRRGKSLSLALQADGIPALRALMNSYGRWFSSIIKTFEKLGSEGKS